MKKLHFSNTKIMRNTNLAKLRWHETNTDQGKLYKDEIQFCLYCYCTVFLSASCKWVKIYSISGIFYCLVYPMRFLVVQNSFTPILLEISVSTCSWSGLMVDNLRSTLIIVKSFSRSIYQQIFRSFWMNHWSFDRRVITNGSNSLA